MKVKHETQAGWRPSQSHPARGHRHVSSRPPVGDPADAAFYSRDGSYLRMKSNGTFRVVEFPDGTRHSFEPEPIGDYYRLARIDDPHGNFVTVTYGATGWTISDSHGRSQLVELIDHDPLDDWEAKVVSRVELEAFDGTTAVYQLRYTSRDIVRECPNNDDELNNPLSIPVLSEVELPDGSMYSMPDYVLPLTNLLCGNQAGRVLALDLPTGGRLEWTYQNYSFPRLEGPISPPPSATQAFETSIGVATRSLIDADGTVLGTWQYDPALTPNLDGGGPGLPQANEMVNTVTDPFGNITQSFFSVDLDGFAFTGDWSVYDYGLPFTRDPATILPGSSPGPEDDFFLSTRTFAADGTHLRSTYVRYEKDVPGTALDVAQAQNMNRRLVAERTVYHDDAGRFSERVLSSFDGVGHYRTLVETGDFEGNPSKTTTTSYNPGRDYEVDDAGSLVGSYAMVAASEPWVLNTYDEQTVTLNEGTFSDTSRVETTFTPETGFLECRRVLKGTSRGADDVLVLFTDGDGDGNVDQEAYYGGNLQDLSTDTGCGAAGTLQAEYRLDHAYEYGALRSTDYVQDCDGTGDGGHVLRVVDLDIDLGTGLTMTSRDASGLATDYIYDDMGRLTTVQPQEEAWTVFDYTPAGPDTAAVATVFRKNGGTTTRLSQQRLVFDGFGRVCVSQEKLPVGGWWNRQDTLYHPTGWTREESVTYRTSTLATQCPSAITTAKTSFEDYDAFGRVGRVVPADGEAHEATFAYQGVRRVDRTVIIATSINGTETAATSSERYNPLGQLTRVVDPSGLHTLYSYDENDRLRQVSQGAQTRLFDYDGRGNLASEVHPELGVSGGGATVYCDYDSRGNAHRKVEGVATTYTCSSSSFGHNDLSFVFDRAERLTQVLDTASGQLMKELFYYHDNVPGEWRLGKLALAKRHNRGVVVFPLRISEQDAIVTETYTYAGLGGRMSNRQTRLWGYTFDLGVTYDTLGAVATLSYPICSHAQCVAPPRTVSFDYTQGRLTGVPGYASSITYHANGLVNQVRHTNGVTDIQSNDPFEIARPGSITFSGFPGVVGTYQYDGASNVKQIGSHRFSYDLESRITDADLGSLGTQSFSYDRFGNRTQIVKDGVTYNYPAGNATNRLTSNDSLYDAAGNLRQISGATISRQVYSYDVFNMVEAVQSASYAANYLYTADDERFVELVTSGSNIVATYTLRGLGNEVLRRFEHVWGEGWFWKKDYVHRGGAMLATETPGGVEHFHLDHLGTPRLITDSAGAEVSQHTYFPFGDEVSPPAQEPERRKFTGHERDSNGVGTSDDLDYMHARYCSPTVGRFLSVDPQGGSPAAPQSLNRYAYGLNNPLRFLDPDGEAPVDLGSIPEQRSARDKKLTGLVLKEFARNTVRSGVNTAKGFANGIIGFGLLASGKNPAVDDDFEAIMFPAETKTDLREQVLGPIAVGLMTGFPQRARGPVMEGIYEFTADSGFTYVGQSGRVPQRTFGDHARTGKLPPGNEVKATEVLGGKTAREIAEQRRINELGGIKKPDGTRNLDNKRNPIGPKRRHLLEGGN